MRTILGGLLGGFVLFMVGFVFWVTPLSAIAYKTAGQNEGAAVQLALSQNLARSGTGTYVIPDHGSAQGTVLYGQGPVATVHFNTSGFPVDDMNMIAVGFILALLTGLLMSFGLAAVAGGRSFSSMARLVVPFSLAFTLWTILTQPVFNHFGWTYWIYSFVADSTAFIAAGLVIARWVLPRTSAAPAEVRAEAREG